MTLPDPPKARGRKPQGKTRSSRTFTQHTEVWDAFDNLPGANDAERFRYLVHGASFKAPKPKIILMDNGTWQVAKDSQK